MKVNYDNDFTEESTSSNENYSLIYPRDQIFKIRPRESCAEGFLFP